MGLEEMRRQYKRWDEERKREERRQEEEERGDT